MNISIRKEVEIIGKQLNEIYINNSIGNNLKEFFLY